MQNDALRVADSVDSLLDALVAPLSNLETRYRSVASTALNMARELNGLATSTLGRGSPSDKDQSSEESAVASPGAGSGQPPKTSALSESERRLRLLIQETPVAVIEWHTVFHITNWNPAAERTFGYAAGEALGKHVSMIVADNDRPLLDTVQAQLLARAGGERSTIENVTKDGQLITCEWVNTPLTSADGNVIGVASLVQDVTELRWSGGIATLTQHGLEIPSVERRIPPTRLPHAVRSLGIDTKQSFI
jgi:PAS domain S-box-containing protein